MATPVPPGASNACKHLPKLNDDDLQYHDKYVCIQPETTDEQMGMIDQLRERVKDIIEERDDVWMLRRFLVAREWSLDGAEEMFRGEKKWRQETFPKTNLSESVLRMLRFKCAEILPFVRDRFDRPLVIITGRNYNPGLNNRDNEQMADMFIWGMELLIASIRPPQPQFVTILDLNGWGLKNFDTKLAYALSIIAKPYYPDYMGSTFIVNYPWVMWGVWKLANVLIEERTKKKIQFLSKEEYSRLFPLMFGAENLPERFGGTKVEEDPPASRREMDPQVCKEWQDVKALPTEEQEAKFKEMLERFLEEQGGDSKDFWLPLVETSNMDGLMERHENAKRSASKKKKAKNGAGSEETSTKTVGSGKTSRKKKQKKPEDPPAE